VLMILSALFALYLQNAKQLFDIIIMFGAGTGLIFILRWFWWRINAWSEISAMVVSGVVSLLFASQSLGDKLFGEEAIMASWAKFPMVVLITTIVWLVVTFITQPETKDVLQKFYKRTQPGGPGWRKVIVDAEHDNIDIVDIKETWSIPSGIIAVLVGCVFIYSIMFSTGNFIYGKYSNALMLLGVTAISGFILLNLWKKIKANVL